MQKEPLHIMLRYNTENKTDQYWRLIVNGKENTYTSVSIICPTITTQDVLTRPDSLEIYTKFHITCLNPKSITISPCGKHVVIN